MPEPYWSDDTVTVYHGDSLDVLPTLPAGSVDAVVCDPPYGLAELSATVVAGALASWLAGDRAAVPDGRGFMGREWDRFVPPPALWDECWRVLKPGGHLLAFAAPRTVDLMTLSIRLARFEIRDAITWMYGSGFPKSLDVSKAIDRAAGAAREVIGSKLGQPGYADTKSTGRMLPTRTRTSGGGYLNVTAPATDDARRWAGWGTALKPASEPIVVARKPLAGTVATNVQAHGTGALNIDGCRVAHAGPADLAASQAKNPGRIDKVTSGVYGAGRGQRTVNDAGRWPTNVILSHPGNEHDGDLCADGCVPGCPVADLDAQSGASITPATVTGGGSRRGDFMKALGRQDDVACYGDSGGASRFFPTFRYQAKADTAERPRAAGVAHPTVKPLTLMRWLVKLVTPPGGTVLDPVLGSGTTAEACIVEGFRCIGVERDPAHLPLIVARLDKPIQPTLDLPTDTPPAADPPAAPAPATLFDNL